MQAFSLNSERELLRILRRLAPGYGLAVEAGSGGWVIRLARPDGARMLVFGYDFGLNPSSSAEAARDKCACFDLLEAAGVAAVEHRIVFRPDWARFTGQASAYEAAIGLFHRCGGDAVCKDNHGTGGELVFRVRSLQELELAMADVFRAHHACAISPYLAIDDEVRVVLVDGEATAVYAKRRKPGEWRHNLGHGAVPDMDVDPVRRAQATALALRAVDALQLRAASVDVVWSGAAAARVLEVNNGIMVESLARSGPAGAAAAEATYRAILEARFGKGAP